MSFPTNRSRWKKPGPRITAKLHDDLTAAIRQTPNDLEAIAERFDLAISTIRRYAGFGR